MDFARNISVERFFLRTFFTSVNIPFTLYYHIIIGFHCDIVTFASQTISQHLGNVHTESIPIFNRILYAINNFYFYVPLDFSITSKRVRAVKSALYSMLTSAIPPLLARYEYFDCRVVDVIFIRSDFLPLFSQQKKIVNREKVADV